MRRARPERLSTKSSSVGWRDGPLDGDVLSSLVVPQRNPLPGDERMAIAGRDNQVVLRHLQPLQGWVVEGLCPKGDVHLSLGQQRRNFPRVEMHGGEIQVGSDLHQPLDEGWQSENFQSFIHAYDEPSCSGGRFEVVARVHHLLERAQRVVQGLRQVLH